jgi:Bacterial PH domain
VTYPVAPLSRLIKIISAAVLILDAGLVVASFVNHWALIPAALIAAVTLGCYLRAPVAYEVSRGGLTIVFRLGSKQFGPVVRVGRVEKSTDRSIRLWGNGGLFAATGIFWNSTWGIFRAYVTTSDQKNTVIVETRTGKVLLSPDNPEEFLRESAGSV